MDMIFGSDRFRDISGPPLPDRPPEDLTKGNGRVSLLLPYIADSPYRGQIRYMQLSERLTAMHTLIAGAINQGKTILICQLLFAILYAMTHLPDRRDDTVIVFDPKGDFRRLFYRQGIDLVISPNGDARWRWNFMDELKVLPEEPGHGKSIDTSVLNVICHILFDRIAQRTSQPFFANAARRTFSAVTERLFQEDGTSNARILNFWNSATLEDIRQLLANNRGVLNYIPSNVEGQSMGVLSEIHGAVSDLFQEGFGEPGEMSIRSALRQGFGRFIFLDFPVSAAETMADSFRVLVALAIREALRMGEENEIQTGRHIWFVIDEFRRLPHIMQLEPGMNFGRSFGLRFILGMQTIEQLKKDYGAEASSILAGANSLFAFWASDAETRNFIKGRGGKKLQRVATENVGIGNPIQDVKEMDCIQDEHIASLEPGQAIACLPQHKPFKIRFPLFDDAFRKEVMPR